MMSARVLLPHPHSHIRHAWKEHTVARLYSTSLYKIVVHRPESLERGVLVVCLLVGTTIMQFRMRHWKHVCYVRLKKKRRDRLRNTRSQAHGHTSIITSTRWLWCHDVVWIRNGTQNATKTKKGTRAHSLRAQCNACMCHKHACSRDRACGLFEFFFW
jgi:hypothetical protein